MTHEKDHRPRQSLLFDRVASEVDIEAQSDARLLVLSGAPIPPSAERSGEPRISLRPAG